MHCLSVILGSCQLRIRFITDTSKAEDSQDAQIRNFPASCGHHGVPPTPGKEVHCASSQTTFSGWLRSALEVFQWRFNLLCKMEKDLAERLKGGWWCYRTLPMLFWNSCGVRFPATKKCDSQCKGLVKKERGCLFKGYTDSE